MIIVPTLTFIAPINAIAYNNANPVFMDADQNYNISLNKTVDFLRKETIFKNGFTYKKKQEENFSNCSCSCMGMHRFRRNSPIV